MSKGGGAGKVYFVLYLAVVLELLIIIVERDEAEQGLLQKQKESMRIVESILSQLQSGAGTEGINTRPQDEITLPPPGVNIEEVFGTKIKSYRKYMVDVGVTDISAELKRKEGESLKDYQNRLKKLVELGNVEEIEYQVFYNTSMDENNAPLFPTEQELHKQGVEFIKFQPGQTVQSPDGASSWQFMGVRKLKLDKDATFNSLNLNNVSTSNVNPVYPKALTYAVGPSFVPANLPEDSSFFYSSEETNKKAGVASGDIKKRSFIVNFQPPSKAGWYKLRFASRTNRILGVRSTSDFKNIDENTTVNIGTVQLTVRDLQKVRKELVSKLEKFNLPSYEALAASKDVDKFDESLRRSQELASRDQDANELISKIKLYGYIVKLLAPGLSSSFDQNRGSIEFNIRVLTPTPKVARPTVDITQDYTACFDKVPAVFEVSVTPFQKNGSSVYGKVLSEGGSQVASVVVRDDGSLATTTTTKEGERKTYRAFVDKALSAGKYTIVMNHKIGSDVAEDRGELEVFEAKLTKESEGMVNSSISYAAYGYPLQINAVPTSGGKIRSQQFRMYMKTDRSDSQTGYIEGLSTTNENALKYDCKDNTVSLKITWVQPFTGNEVTIFPEKSATIAQSSPKINIGSLNNTPQQVDATKMKITIKGVRLTRPADGTADNNSVDIKFEVDQPKPNKVAEENGTFSVSQPSFERDGDAYNISFDFTVTPASRNVDMINGAMIVPVRAYAINKCNGKKSSVESKTINASFNWERQVGKGGGSKGGTRPSGGQRPSGGGQRPSGGKGGR